MKRQVYVIVSTENGGTHNVQGMLEEGWRPVRETPMGSAGDFAYALVLLEKDV
ncbi:hypothetical protein Pan216_23190 [Planctomycetes bacterium Pan216]|uniref:DUF1737 domain-containing protein n=1 Tax=Kolteria novifilia TaxID=2527975 RepID=A0A518B392_9BACT|nr:hypothetical protein Pan216_23190 [Planctomycetes bacterium Pan216]